MKNQTLLQFTKRFAALAGAAVLTAVTALGGTANAADYTMVTSGNETFTLNKYLVMDKTANVPAATFEFTLGTTDVTADPSSPVPVYVGVTPEKVTWGGSSTQSVKGNITFTASSATTVVGAGSDPADITAGSYGADKKYATESTTLDFSKCDFTKPGVYRYSLKETTSSLPSGVTAVDAERFLDVYVIDAETSGAMELKVAKCILHKSKDAKLDASGTYTSATTTWAKSEGVVNTYQAQDLTISHKTAGNQGDKTKAFTYTLKITNVPDGSKFTVESTSGVALTAGSVGSVSGNEITAAATGVEVTFELKDGESIQVKNLPDAAKYAISVENGDYTATYDKDGSAGTGNSANDSISGAAQKVAFTLTKTGVIPTGVIMTVAPFAAVTLLGAAGIAGVTRRKKNEDEE